MAKVIRFLGLDITATKNRCRQSMEGSEFPSETGRRAAAPTAGSSAAGHPRAAPPSPPSSLSLGRWLAGLALATLDATSSQRRAVEAGIPHGVKNGLIRREYSSEWKIHVCCCSLPGPVKRNTVQGRTGWPLDAFPACLAYCGVVRGTECHRAAATNPMLVTRRASVERKPAGDSPSPGDADTC